MHPIDDVTVADVIRATVQVLEVSEGDLLGPRRTRALVAARHIAMYVCRQETGATFSELEQAFDRDHTTIIYALHKIANANGSVHRRVEAVRAAL